MTPEERQRLLIGLLLAAHRGDETGFRVLLRDVPEPVLRTIVRALAEVVIAGQMVTEDVPGAARESLAREALSLAAR